MIGRWQCSLLLASHAAALVAGVMIWKFIRAGHELRADKPEKLTPAEWTQNRLAQARDEHRKYVEQIHFEETATLEQRLKRDRDDRLSADQELAGRIQKVRARAATLDSLADPAARIRAIQLENNDLVDLLPAYLVWLHRDRKAALAHLAHWLDVYDPEGLETGAILQAELGDTWANEALGSDSIPYALRICVSRNAGRIAGIDGGLTRLLGYFRSTNDSRLRAALTETFVAYWLAEDPKASARFLVTEAPPELRDLLLCGWRDPMALGYAWVDWRTAMNKELKTYPIPDYVMEIADTFPLTEAPGFFGPKPPNPEPLADDFPVGADGTSAQLESILQWKVREWIEEGTDLRELYCEGRIPRSELLDGLQSRIPGSEKYPAQLERAAWVQTMPWSDPDQAASWGRELLRKGDVSGLLDDARRQFSSEHRIMKVLDRLRVESTLDPKPWMLGIIREDVVKAWREWNQLSPPDARRWMAALPSNSPLTEALLKAQPDEPDTEEGK